MVDIIICGAAGRMGRAIIEAASADSEVNIVGLVEAPSHPGMQEPVRIKGQDMQMTAQLPRERKAVVVDFSAPAATSAHLRDCVIREYPMVIGTTGLGDSEMKDIEHASRKIAVVQSSNMSTGVNVLWRAVRELTRALKDSSDIEIIEAHHNRKKDAPSGTALTIADIVSQVRERPRGKDLAHGRQGKVGERRAGEVGMHAIRAGDIAGDHTVMFGMEGERIEITHRAHGRAAFAHGAVKAAKFVATAAPGFYTMAQVLGLELPK